MSCLDCKIFISNAKFQVSFWIIKNMFKKEQLNKKLHLKTDSQILQQEVKLYYKIMNLNSPSTTDFELRKAVEEQLDLILKIEEQRKALRKQNKLLHQKLKETNNMISKYSRQTVSAETNTENDDQTNSIQDASPVSKSGASGAKCQQIGVQIDIGAGNNSSIISRSKLDEAQSLLKVLDSYEPRVELSNIVNAEDYKRNRSFHKQDKQKSIEKPKNSKAVTHEQAHQPDKQIAAQMLKLTKELNAVKRQLRQSDHKYKLRQKQINDLKKCLQTKNQALEKSRKEFNQLSMLMNSDKMKSVRNLQNQVRTLRAKLIEQEDGMKLRCLFQDLTKEYQQFRKQTERKIDILVSQLAAKEKEVSFWQSEQRRNNGRVLQN